MLIMKEVQLGFIGAGNMANAIIHGILKNGSYQPGQIHFYDLNAEKSQALTKQGLIFEADALKVVDACDIIVLAVKPQNYQEVLSEIKPAVTAEKLFVTIAAGISIGFIQRALEIPCPVVRAMPNTPLLLGKGATALCQGENVTAEAFERVYELFAASGEVAVLPEDQMNTIIAVNGSSPAYVYLFAKAILDYASAQGIAPEAALRLTCKTLEGSAAMLRESGHTPDELIKMVSSPGGTTLKALEALEAHDFYGALQDAMARCTQRAEELGK